MTSPFPGMDPFIEACGLWGDFHSHLIEAIYQRLADTVPERYLVRTQERSYLALVAAEGEEFHAFIPDVGVTSPPEQPSAPGAGSATAVAETATETTAEADTADLRAFIAEEFKEAFVEIYEADADQRLITCIEVLSPSNKRRHTEGWDLYQRKRQALMLSGTSLVEIDLLRGGDRMPMLDSWPASPYTLTIARRYRRGRCRVWQGHYRRPLPVIPVPLVPPDADLTLDVQPMIAAIYARSRYHRSIDYSKPLTPPLPADDTAWLHDTLRQRSAST